MKSLSPAVIASLVVSACGYPNPARSSPIIDAAGGGDSTGSATSDGKPCSTGSITFPYTGAPVTYALPACVTTITVDLTGAAGGSGCDYNSNNGGGATGAGGMGARVQGTLAITAGAMLTVNVGGLGIDATFTDFGNGGFNGGGDGATDEGGFSYNNGGGGGGASDIRIGGTDVTDRVAHSESLSRGRWAECR